MTLRLQSAPFALVAFIGVLSSACRRDSDSSPGARTVARTGETLSSAIVAPPPAARWLVRRLNVAPARFRPAAWSSENDLWGLLDGRVTRLDVRTGDVRRLSATAWSINAALGVVSWRNETGLWQLRDGGAPVRLTRGEPDPQGFDAPADVLWSSDGTRALLAWQAEWNARHVLLEPNGSMRDLETKIPEYFLNSAVLWLDSQRVLFHTVAMGPVGGAPEYRESGWRGNLAVLDLRTRQYRLVTGVPDSIHLRVAGLYHDDVLVTEWDRSGIRGHWLYDPTTWRRRPAPLPRGRAYACAGGAAVVLLDWNAADATDAVLIAGSDTTRLGKVARDAQPACSPSGRRGALRTGMGVVLFEAR